MRLKRIVFAFVAGLALVVAPSVAQASTASHVGGLPMPTAGNATPAYSSQNDKDLAESYDALGDWQSSLYIEGYNLNATAINMQYYGTVSSSSEWPFTDSGWNSTYNGYAAYVIYDRSTGYCFGVNTGDSNAIEETNHCGGTGNPATMWVAVPAQNDESGEFSLVNVRQNDTYGENIMMHGYGNEQRWSDNYQDSYQPAEDQESFYLLGA